MEHKHNHRYREHFDGCQMGGWLGGDRNYWSSRQFLLMGLHRDLFRLTLSEVQCVDSSLKGTGETQGGSELSTIRAIVGDNFLPERNVGRDHCSLFEPSLLRAS